MLECFERVCISWERFLVTISAQLQHLRFSSVSMYIEVVFTYSLSLKEILTLVTFNFSIFVCLHLLWVFFLLHSRGWNHIFHNYDTKVEKDTLINEDDAHKVFFSTFSDILKIFYMWPNRMNLQVRCHTTHSHYSHVNRVSDSQNSDFDDDTIANEDGKLFTEKVLFSSK